MRAAAYNVERLPVPQATNHPGDDHSDQFDSSDDSDRDVKPKTPAQRAVYKALKGNSRVVPFSIAFPLFGLLAIGLTIGVFTNYLYRYYGGQGLFNRALVLFVYNTGFAFLEYWHVAITVSFLAWYDLRFRRLEALVNSQRLSRKQWSCGAIFAITFSLTAVAVIFVGSTLAASALTIQANATANSVQASVTTDASTAFRNIEMYFVMVHPMITAVHMFVSISFLAWYRQRLALLRYRVKFAKKNSAGKWTFEVPKVVATYDEDDERPKRRPVVRPGLIFGVTAASCAGLFFLLVGISFLVSPGFIESQLSALFGTGVYICGAAPPPPPPSPSPPPYWWDGRRLSNATAPPAPPAVAADADYLYNYDFDTGTYMYCTLLAYLSRKDSWLRILGLVQIYGNQIIFCMHAAVTISFLAWYGRDLTKLERFKRTVEKPPKKSKSSVQMQKYDFASLVPSNSRIAGWTVHSV